MTYQSPQFMALEAERLERRFEYESAHRLYLIAADEYRAESKVAEAIDCLMRSARAREKGDARRLIPACWEKLGDSVGESLGEVWRPVKEPGLEGMHRIIGDGRWAAPEDDFYEQDANGIARHQQAWAYYWAALNLERTRHTRLACILWRKAAYAWRQSAFDSPPDTESRRPRDNKWRLAADCHRRALVNLIRFEGGLRDGYALGPRYTRSELDYPPRVDADEDTIDDLALMRDAFLRHGTQTADPARAWTTLVSAYRELRITSEEEGDDDAAWEMYVQEMESETDTLARQAAN